MSIRNGHARWAFDFSSWRPSLSDLLKATSCIQPEEKERLSKFIFRDDFQASLIGRLLMRKFVRDTIKLPYDQIKFERDAKEKPHLSINQIYQHEHGGRLNNSTLVDFNVSHQGCFAVLAGCTVTLSDYSKSQIMATSQAPIKIGVDVMKIEYTGGKPLTEFFRLMNKNFSSNEWAYIMSMHTDSEQIEAFMRHWCLKESYVKNIGVGITIDLQKISFTIKTKQLSCNTVVNDTTLMVDGDEMTNWIFEESLLNDGTHCVAVSLNCNDNNNGQRIEATTTFELLDFNKLMENSVPLLDEDLDYCTAILNKSFKK